MCGRLLQITMAIAREVASVTKLGVEVCPLYRLSFISHLGLLGSRFRIDEVKYYNYILCDRKSQNTLRAATSSVICETRDDRVPVCQ